MILISHRGNLNGPILERENSPDYIDEAINEAFEVEIDVWFSSGKLMLGHDFAQYLVDINWLRARRHSLWCHAKNVEALQFLLDKGMHAFWHQEDDVTLTSEGYIWTYPGKKLHGESIAVMPEKAPNWEMDKEACVGVCSDYIINFVTRDYLRL